MLAIFATPLTRLSNHLSRISRSCTAAVDVDMQCWWSYSPLPSSETKLARLGADLRVYTSHFLPKSVRGTGVEICRSRTRQNLGGCTPQGSSHCQRMRTQLPCFAWHLKCCVREALSTMRSVAMPSHATGSSRFPPIVYL